MSKYTSAVIAAMLSFSLVVGCSADPPAPTLNQRVSDDTPAGPPLPAGATTENAGEFAALPVDREGVQGSLRPDNKPAEDRVPEIYRRGRLIVGVDQSLNLISFRNARTGELQGFEVQIAREIARDIFGDPDAIELRFVESAERFAPLRDGSVDMIIRTMSMTTQRQKEVAFSTPYLNAQTRMLTGVDTNIGGPDDLSGNRVCVADGSTGLQTTRRIAPESPILKTRNWTDCLVALQQNQVEAIISDDALLSGFVDQDAFTRIVGPSMSQERYSVAMPKGDDELVRQVNSTMERIFADGTWSQIFNEWFGPYLRENQPPPLHYRDEEDPKEDHP